VHLSREGLCVRGLRKKEAIALNKVFKITDLSFMHPRLVIIKFTDKTSFGSWVMLIPKREGFLKERTDGLSTLRRMTRL
jgi:hypothetical protein